jgi:TP901 family phage tail tape measure protein
MLRWSAFSLVPFALGLKAAGDFEKQLKMVSTMLDDPESFMGAYKSGLRALSIQFGESTETLAKGLYDLLSASVPPEKALGVLTQTVKMAKAGMTDTATATAALVNILNAYHIPAERAAEVSDMLFMTVKRGVVTFPELAEYIGAVTATSNAAGISMDEMGASIATMTRNGMKADLAVTALQNILSEFLKPTDDGAAAAKRFGVQLSVAQLQTEGLLGTMQKLSTASPAQLAQMFPDVRGLRGILALRGDMAGFAKDVGLMGGKAGATENAFRKMNGGINSFLAKIMQVGTAVFSAIGESIAKPFERIGRVVTTVGPVLVEFLSRYRDIVGKIAMGAIAASAVSVGFIAVGTSLKLAAFALGGFSSLLAGTIGLVRAAVVLTGAWAVTTRLAAVSVFVLRGATSAAYGSVGLLAAGMRLARTAILGTAAAGRLAATGFLAIAGSARAAAVAAGPVGSALMAAVSAIYSGVSMAIPVISSGIVAVMTGILAIPQAIIPAINLWFAGVEAVAGATVAIWTGAVRIITVAWTAAPGMIVAAWSTLKTLPALINSVVATAGRLAFTAWSALPSLLMSGFTTALAGLSAALPAILTGVIVAGVAVAAVYAGRALLAAFLPSLKNMASAVADSISKGVASGVSSIASFASQAGSLLANLAGTVGRNFATVWQGVSAGASVLWSDLKTGWANVSADAQAAYAGISDAIAAGDIQAAMGVASAFVKLEWQRTVNYVQERWWEFKSFWNELWTGSLLILNNFTAKFKTIWGEAIGWLRKAWAGFKTSGFTETLADWLAPIFAKMQGVPVDQVRQTLKEDMERGRKNLPNETANIDADTKRRADEIEAERKREEDRLGAGAGTAASGRQGAIDKAQKDLAAAQKELDDARKRASASRRKADAALGGGSAAMPGGLPKIDYAGISDKISVAGTFSGYAAGMMGTGSAEERTAKATERTAEAVNLMNTLQQQAIQLLKLVGPYFT